MNWQELANPYVHPHLELYPEDAHGHDIYKFSQRMKWLKRLPPDLWVQMIEEYNKHYYIFEPTILKSGQMVIPVFFYKDGLEMFAKCVIPHVLHQVTPPQVVIQARLDSGFDLPALQAVNVTELDLIYPEIQVGQLGCLSDLCRNELWSDSHLSQFNLAACKRS